MTNIPLGTRHIVEVLSSEQAREINMHPVYPPIAV
jgi:hypothetical protein